ncbi:MAG: cell division protein FtsZ, partial [Pseudoxanthomonas sp.]
TGSARGDDRAQAAAEAAIQNPLLDDVNLSGANGILVNITAGPDFTMAEFDEVGRTIEGFAAEDATVVLGTVLDPDMQDEVRVTVVATGLNRTAAARAPIGRNDGLNLREPMRVPVKLVRDGTTGMAYDANAGMDAVATAVGGLGLRRGSADPASAPASAAPAVADMPDYLDIPAFLRRQAD